MGRLPVDLARSCTTEKEQATKEREKKTGLYLALKSVNLRKRCGCVKLKRRASHVVIGGSSTAVGRAVCSCGRRSCGILLVRPLDQSHDVGLGEVLVLAGGVQDLVRSKPGAIGQCNWGFVRGAKRNKYGGDATLGEYAYIHTGLIPPHRQKQYEVNERKMISLMDTPQHAL